MSTSLPCVPVGIDLGSCQARVAVGSMMDVSSNSNTNTTARVVSNTQGHRSTLAMAAAEECVSTDENSKKKKPQDPSFIYGDAALKLLQKEGETQPHTVREQLEHETNTAACQSFLGHLGRLAADASACGVSQLRVAISVPVDATSEYTKHVQHTTEQGMRAQLTTHTSKKKPHMVVGVVSDPAAVCMAHGLMDAAGSDESSSESRSSTHYSSILVIDGGASGLTVSKLQTCGSTSRLLRVVKHERLVDVSSHAFVTLLAKHVVSQFERKHKLVGVWESRKARAKLTQACETAIQSLYSSKAAVHVTIDGLYEGIDCHIPISPPRWNMLTGPLLNKARVMMERYVVDDSDLDAVLLAGSVSSMLAPIVDKVLQDTNNTSVFRGLPTIPPEEAVALGCARHAASCVTHTVVTHRHAHQVHNVPISPVAIGIGGDETEDKDSNTMETVISLGTPLPAHVVHTRPCSAASLAVWQLVPDRKIVAKLQDLPSKGKLEILVELTSHGKLSVAVQGGPAVAV